MAQETRSAATQDSPANGTSPRAGPGKGKGTQDLDQTILDAASLGGKQ